MFETWHIGFYVSAIGSRRMSSAKPLRWSSYRKKCIKFQVGLTLHLVIFPLQVQIPRYKYLKLSKVCFMFGNRLLKNEFCQVLMFDLTVYENIRYFKLDWRSNQQYASKVKIQRHRCLKLDILGFMFRQSAHEEWVLPSYYVGAHAVKKYIKFQVELTLYLAIFRLKSKYKDTNVWNLA